MTYKHYNSILGYCDGYIQGNDFTASLGGLYTGKKQRYIRVLIFSSRHDIPKAIPFRLESRDGATMNCATGSASEAKSKRSALKRCTKYMPISCKECAFLQISKKEQLYSNLQNILCPDGILLSFARALPYLLSFLVDRNRIKTLADILECALIYIKVPSSVMRRSDRPYVFRKSILGRVPPTCGAETCI